MDQVSWRACGIPEVCVEEADGKMNVALKRHVLPLIRTCEPSLKQGELKTMEGV